jgi:hypothetical protein
MYAGDLLYNLVIILPRHVKILAIDSKTIYLTKINYCMRARSGRPKDDVGMPVNLSSWLELRVTMITDNIHELGLDITPVWSRGRDRF